MASRKLLREIVPSEWDSQKPGPNTGTNRVRYLQDVDDLVARPLNNRQTASTSATAVTCNGVVQSSGIGSGTIQPKRYAELTVKARVTFNINSAGPAFIYVYRTTGAIPANGSAPNAGDAIVGGDSFMGGPTTSGVNQSGNLSFLDTGLSVNQMYRYYLAVKAPNGNTLNLVNSSQILVLERS